VQVCGSWSILKKVCKRFNRGELVFSEVPAKFIVHWIWRVYPLLQALQDHCRGGWQLLDSNDRMKKLIIPASFSSLEKIRDYFSHAAKEAGLDDEAVFEVQVACG